MAPEAGSMHTPGARVWLQQAGAWHKGIVVSTTDATCVCQVEGRDVEVAASSVFLRNQEGQNADDMTSLTHLHEPGVLHNLGERYVTDKIYTNTGSILIAVNPFKRIPALVEQAVMGTYQAQLWQHSDKQSSLPPHVYGTAVAAYKQMLRDGAGQAILITGESGAGKTETCKLIMRCLAHLGSHQAAGHAAAAASLSAGFSIEQKVLESNPLLEAFGNAKTSRNDNSSRFGKYVEIQFDGYGQLVGAAVRTYLLERSRVVHIVSGERSFHAFYQMCAGASSAERQAWHLGRSTDYALLCQSDCQQLPGTNDGEEYQVTRHAMTCVGMSDVDQQAVFATLAAILHLGNVTWAEAHAAVSCPEDLATTFQLGATDLEVPLPADEASWRAMAWAAELLQVPGAQLLSALNTRTRHTPDGPIISPLSAAAAEDSRNALSKVIYARLFAWIVSCVNTSLAQHRTSRVSSRSGGLDQVADAAPANGNGNGNGLVAAGAGSDGGAAQASSHTIGLLDIYGFESFQVNDLEQLCINLANEKLQQHFNQHVFKWEQAEYTREGVDWRYINFIDNQDVLDLVEGRFGLLDLLDEQSRFPTATAADLAYKYGASQTISGSKRFEKLKRPPTGFAIEHYAGPVTYTTDNFLDKNRDYVVAEHATLLGASTCNLIASLFGSADTTSNGMPTSNSSTSLATKGLPAASPPVNGASKSAFKFDSVSSQFKRQLQDLMSALHIMQPHYVRCIKPNPGNKPGVFDQQYVLQQLRCGGVMEAVRISCAGFSYKRPFHAFLDYFWPLCPSAWHAVRHVVQKQQHDTSTTAGNGLAESDQAVLKAAAKQVLVAAGLTQFHLGHTKLFLKAQQAADLDKQRNAAFSAAATRIQAVWKGVLARRQFAQAQAAVRVLQSAVRGWCARQLAERLRRDKAATFLQAVWRSRVAQRQLREWQQAAEMLQGYWRGRAARISMREYYREKAAIVLQAYCRARAPRQAYQEVLPYLRAAVHIQRAWRSCRRGTKLQEAFRQAAYDILALSRAAVVAQTAYRAYAGRQQLAQLRKYSKRKLFMDQLQRFQTTPGGGGGGQGGSPGLSPGASRGLSAVKTPANGMGVSRSESMDRGSPRAYISPRMSYNRQTLLDVHSQRDAHKGESAVRELDTIANNSADARRAARLRELDNFKIGSLLNMWKGMEQPPSNAPTPARAANGAQDGVDPKALPTSNSSSRADWNGQGSGASESPSSVQSYGQLI